MKDNYLIRLEDLVNNPTPRVPICLCLDTSGSMAAVEGACETTGETIYQDGRTWNVATGGIRRVDELQKGVEKFYEAIREDEVAVYSAEICIVTFDSKATCVMDFHSVLHLSSKQAMADNNLHLYLYILVFFFLIDQEQVLLLLPSLYLQLVDERKLTVFPIGIGNESDMSVLDKFSPGRKALKLQGMKFQEFFAWLSKSVSKTSQSMPGESIKLDVEGIKGWAEL